MDWGLVILIALKAVPIICILVTIHYTFKAIGAFFTAFIDGRDARRQAQLTHQTNYHYFDFTDRYYDYAKCQWIMK